MSPASLPSWLPAGARDIQEEAAQDALHKIHRCEVHVPLLQRSLQTAYLETAAAAAGIGGTEPPLVFLSSFDASCLEFRMLIPLLEAAGTEAWAVDVVGWGFTEAGIQPGSKEVLGAAERRAHLLAFWQQKIRRPAVFVGSSIGASTVVDFALHHPEATAKLVLMGPAAWNEGLGVFPRLPRWIASVIAQGLRSKWYRRRSLPDVYFDHALATEDMLRIHTLHTDLPGWSEAVMAFARGGGYQLRSGFSRLEMDTLIIWGLNDNFVNPKGAPNYQENIKHCQIVWLEQCGHCASVERPEEVANLLLKFLKSGLPVQTV